MYLDVFWRAVAGTNAHISSLRPFQAPDFRPGGGLWQPLPHRNHFECKTEPSCPLADGRFTSVQPFRNNGDVNPRFHERPHLIIVFFCPTREKRVSAHFFRLQPGLVWVQQARCRSSFADNGPIRFQDQECVANRHPTSHALHLWFLAPCIQGRF